VNLEGMSNAWYSISFNDGQATGRRADSKGLSYSPLTQLSTETLFIHLPKTTTSQDIKGEVKLDEINCTSTTLKKGAVGRVGWELSIGS